LERQQLFQQLKFKAHYFGVSEILKCYVGARYGFDAPESTTGEMISVLIERKCLSDMSMGSLRSMFEKLDRVKFTDSIPEPDEATALLAQAKVFIRETRRNQMEASSHAF
jgi:hypothetical protein